MPYCPLAALAAALAEAGWATKQRDEDHPPALIIWHPDTPAFGESIQITEGLCGWSWYRASQGEALAPCSDPYGAADQLTALLMPYVRAVRASLTERPPWWRRRLARRT